MTLGLVRGRRQHRVARVDGRRVVGEGRRGGGTGGGVLAVVVPMVGVAIRGEVPEEDELAPVACTCRVMPISR